MQDKTWGIEGWVEEAQEGVVGVLLGCALERVEGRGGVIDEVDFKGVGVVDPVGWESACDEHQLESGDLEGRQNELKHRAINACLLIYLI